MKNIYFTVGPSQLYPTVEGHIKQALKEDILSISHRGNKFIEIYKELDQNMRKMLTIPPTHHIFFTGNSIESMERIIANTVAKKSFHILSGEFSKRFYQIAIDLNKKPITFELPRNGVFNPNEIQIPKETELLCVTENETSIGLQLPLEGIKEIKKNNPSLLIAVDIVSSVPITDIDYSYIDIAFFSVQKGLGLPAGLGVLVVSDKAIEKAYYMISKNISVGTTEFSFPTLMENEKAFSVPFTSGTSNVFDIYLLSKITKDINLIGIEKIREEAKIKAQLIYDYFDNESKFKPVIKGAYRSITTPVIDVIGNAEKIAKSLANHGYIVSKGYRQYVNDHIRIANFPAHSITDMKKLIIAFRQIEKSN